MIYYYRNFIKGEPCYANSREEAEQELSIVREQYLEQIKDRFTTTKETVDEEGHVTWIGVDLDNSEEEGTYNVFNTLDGTHNKVEGKAAALSLRSEFYRLLLENYGLFEITECEEIPVNPLDKMVESPETIIIG